MNQPKYDTIRGWLAYELYKRMQANKDIVLLTGDLGFGLWDEIKRDFPDRFVNVGAAEQSMLGIAVGLALKGKIPFTYTITSFYLRAAETIGLYLDGEQIPVKMLGSGLDQQYEHDGPSHNGTRAQNYLKSLNLVYTCPETKEDVSIILDEVIANGQPTFMGLRK